MQECPAGKFHFEPPFTSFDHLVGAREHARWHIEAKRLCSLEIDHRFVLGRRLHRKVGRLLALEDASGCDATEPKRSLPDSAQHPISRGKFDKRPAKPAKRRVMVVA